MNGHIDSTLPTKYDSLDDLEAALRFFHCKVGGPPGLWKADIDAAFRRLPVKPEHRWTQGFAFRCNEQVWCSAHLACPFGATASVRAWEAVGHAIAQIARHYLKLPVLRYVDDYFAPARRGSMQHGMESFLELVCMLLGDGAVVEARCECGRSFLFVRHGGACVQSRILVQA